MKYYFRFSSGELKSPQVFKINPSELAKSNPLIGRLRQHLKSGGLSEGKADHVVAGFVARCMKAYGMEYFVRVSTALESIFQARHAIADELDGILRGELPQFAKIREKFHEIDLAMPEVVSPKDFVPPRVPLSTLLKGGEAARPISSATEFMNVMKSAVDKLPAGERNLLNAANGIEPDALKSLLTAEAESSLRPSAGKAPAGRPYETMVGKLRDAGWDEPKINSLLGAIENMNKEWRGSKGFTPPGYQTQIDESINSLAKENLPDVNWLQNSIRRNPALKSLLASNPQQLIEYWKNFRSEPRRYGFSKYVWYNMHHVRGKLGEYGAAFELGRGHILIFLKGPEGEVTVGGTDLVAFDRNTGEIFAIDNKAVKSTILSKVTALMRNIPQNLEADAAAFREALGKAPHPAVESVVLRIERAARKVRDVVSRLSGDEKEVKAKLDSNALVTLPGGKQQPVQEVIAEILRENGIQRVVTESGGKLQQLSSALEESGIELERLNDLLPEGGEQ